MAQFARPTSTTGGAGWTVTGAASAAAATAETVQDGNTSYAACPQSNLNVPITFNLSSVSDPGVHINHTLRVWMANNLAGASFFMELLDGATVIKRIPASGSTATSTTYTNYGVTLTTAEALSLTGYSNLKLRITTTSAGGLSELRVTQIEFEVPDVLQYARPISDTTAGTPSSRVGATSNWDAWNEVDPDDATSYTSDGSATDTMEVKLSTIGVPASTSNHNIVVRLRRSSANAGTTVALYKGATQIVAPTNIQPAADNVWETKTVPLSPTQAGSGGINGDYTDLRIRITHTNTLSATDVTQAYLSAPLGALALSRTSSDAVGVADANDRTTAGVKSASDTATLGESLATAAGHPRDTSDSIAFTDSATRAALAVARLPTDAVALTDTATRQSLARTRSASDTAAVTDSAVGSPLIVRTSSDAVTVTDAATRAASAFIRATNDSVSVSDAATRAALAVIRSISDAVSLAESLNSAAQHARATSDSVAVADSAIGLRVILRQAADTITTTDAATRALSLSSSPSDTVTLAEVAARAAYSRQRSAADAMSTADTVTGLRVINGLASDTIYLPNTLTVSLFLAGTAADVLSVTDNTTRGPANHFATASDALILVDLATMQATMSRQTADSVTLNETLLSGIAKYAFTSDSVHLAEALTHTYFTTAAPLFSGPLVVMVLSGGGSVVLPSYVGIAKVTDYRGIATS